MAKLETRLTDLRYYLTTTGNADVIYCNADRVPVDGTGLK